MTTTSNTASSTTIVDYILQMKHRPSHQKALMFKKQNQWRTYSWSEYFENVLRVASVFLSNNIQKGDRIAVMSNTRLEWAIIDAACLSIGAILIPIYQTSTSEEVLYILNNSEPKILVIENQAAVRTYDKIKSKVISPLMCILLEEAKEILFQSLSWNEVLSLGMQKKDEQSTEFFRRANSITKNDIATILYTSGTTGVPKGVVLTHTQILSEVSDAFPLLSATADDIALSFLPYSHILGRIEIWGHIYTGHTLAFAESLEKIKQNLIEIRPTFMIAVPRIFEKIYAGVLTQVGTNSIKAKLFHWALTIGTTVAHHRMKKENIPLTLVAQYELAKKLVLNKVTAAFGGRLRFAVSGGAPLSRELGPFFLAFDILLLEGYGLTETTAAICVNTPYDFHFGTVGKPIGDVQVKIAEDGEILVKSKKVMREYYKNEEATTEVLKDGWFATGDIGEITSQGQIRITDRKKDLIKTAGGKYVAPQKLEGLIKRNPYVSCVLIHGDKRKYIVALITLDPIKLEEYAKANQIEYDTYENLTQHASILEMVRKTVTEANNELANYESIKKFSVLKKDFTVAEGELTPSMKVKRKFLDQKFKAQIEALYD